MQRLKFVREHWLIWLQDQARQSDPNDFLRMPKAMLVAILAMIGFPLYFLIWTYVYPQPYENLPLRLLGSLLWLPILLSRYLGARLGKYFYHYWQFAILFTFPFFFTFMLLKNSSNQVWLMSSLTALFVMTLIVTWLELLVMIIVGCLAAFWAAQATSSGFTLSGILFEELPIFVFAAIAGIAMNFTNEKINRGRLNGMLMTASTVAHELRTPLLGIKAGAAGLKQFLPSLIEGYRLAQKHELAVMPIRQTHLDGMEQVLGTIEKEVDYSNSVIDILLTNSAQNIVKPEMFTTLSMANCIRIALDRFPFAGSSDRNLIMVDTSEDFRLSGSEILMVHVYFNLIKNSLYAITKVNKGKINIVVKRGETINTVIFKDTGAGIPANVLPHIFGRFYSWHSENSKFGTGVGLAFCKMVIESFGGRISCRSKLGEFTEFELSFPHEKK